MTNIEIRDAINEMLRRFNTERELWIRRWGTELGFEGWFTSQALKDGVPLDVVAHAFDRFDKP